MAVFENCQLWSLLVTVVEVTKWQKCLGRIAMRILTDESIVLLKSRSNRL